MSGRSIGIRAKTLLALAGTLGFGALVLVGALRGFLLDGYLRSESAEMQEELNHVAGQIAFMVDDLSEYAAEYSAWDDTWDYLGGQNPDYFSENFTFAGAAYKTLSLVAILDDRGALVAGTTYDADSRVSAPLPQEFLELVRRYPRLRTHAAPGDQLTGLIALGGFPMLLASRPVVRNEFAGPIRGTLLIGEYLGDRLTARLKSPALQHSHVYTLADPNLPAPVREAVQALRAGDPMFISRPDRLSMAGYLLLPDVSGAPAFALRLDLERGIYANGLLSLRILMVAFVAVVLTTGGIYLVLLEKTVLKPVIRLGESVRRVGEGAASPEGIAVDGTDEVASLAAHVREAFMAEKRLKGDLEEAAQALERRVAERTQDLRETVDSLSAEIAVRRQAEKRIRGLESQQRAVFDNMLTSLVTFDEELLVTDINPSALRLLRATASCVGRPIARALPEPFAGEVVAAFRSGVGTFARDEVRVRIADGRELTLGYALSSVAPAGGIGRTGILLFFDRTDEKRLAAEQQRLSRLVTLGEFSAQVAHELRNPLTAMSSTVQYLADSCPGGDQEPMRVITESIERMEGIIRRMRLLSREMPLTRTAVDLGDLLARLLGFLEHSLRAQGIVPRFRRPPGAVIVTGDTAQLHQALLNLLMNAMQAMPGGGRLRVRLARGRHTVGAPAPVMILLADTGVGISPETAGRIFDPFYTTREAGSGLGLPIADRIVREHGGSIRFTSRPGYGASFAVILPGAAEGGGACPAS